MCTVVIRWAAGAPVEVLALRDELRGREFDDPGAWWPAQPTVIGGRDSTAGGSWAVTDVAAGTTALVLNRPERRQAEAGAPSRGILPLLAVAHGHEWPARVDLTGMASFTVLLAGPSGVAQWLFDGAVLTRTELAAGTHMVTSGGAEDGKAARYLDGFARSDPGRWVDQVRGRTPQDDPAALVVRHQEGERVFATVFGQRITSTPGRLQLSYSRTPWAEGDWTQQVS